MAVLVCLIESAILSATSSMLSVASLILVGSLCLGVGTLWVSAYHLTSLANYYEAVKGFPSVEVQ